MMYDVLHANTPFYLYDLFSKSKDSNAYKSKLRDTEDKLEIQSTSISSTSKTLLKIQSEL
jgi:hypothetical protein